jgi:cob(I)alamin adenosyltransferase
MKVYTGAGDRGMTGLFSGERVAKSNIRVAANGDVDELNSFLGALAAVLGGEHATLAAEIQRIQSELFHVGAWLATTPDSTSTELLAELSTEPVSALESAIAAMESDLPGLQGFILPGGHPAAVWAHLARTVCRRAERQVVRLLEVGESNQPAEQLFTILAYLNRLSDYLFVLARYCNRLEQTPDVLWQ